jgi:hypothetical protein
MAILMQRKKEQLKILSMDSEGNKKERLIYK